jgi:hypothetical protein
MGKKCEISLQNPLEVINISTVSTTTACCYNISIVSATTALKALLLFLHFPPFPNKNTPVRTRHVFSSIILSFDDVCASPLSLDCHDGCTMYKRSRLRVIVITSNSYYE